MALTPRPPGPPRYYPEQHLTGPNPYDLTFAMAVSPYHGLTYGSRFNVVLTVTNQERRPVVVSTFMSFGRQIVVTVVNTGGGEVERLDNHDPATNSKYPFFVRGVNYPDRKLKPGITRMRAVVEIIDVLCPGGGGFITEIAGGIAHVIKRGSNGGRHLAWVENDAADYAKKRLAEGSGQHRAAALGLPCGVRRVATGTGRRGLTSRPSAARGGAAPAPERRAPGG